MKKKIISIIGLALFMGAVVFNVQMNNLDQQDSKLTLSEIAMASTNSVEKVTCSTYCAEVPGCACHWCDPCNNLWMDYNGAYDGYCYTEM